MGGNDLCADTSTGTFECIMLTRTEMTLCFEKFSHNDLMALIVADDDAFPSHVSILWKWPETIVLVKGSLSSRWNETHPG